MKKAMGIKTPKAGFESDIRLDEELDITLDKVEALAKSQGQNLTALSFMKKIMDNVIASVPSDIYADFGIVKDRHFGDHDSVFKDAPDVFVKQKLTPGQVVKILKDPNFVETLKDPEVKKALQKVMPEIMSTTINLGGVSLGKDDSEKQFGERSDGRKHVDVNKNVSNKENKRSY